MRIDARDVSIALSRPMDISITNRLPGRIAELVPLSPPYVRATCDLGMTQIHALIMRESVDRLALVPGLRTWVMIKAAAIAGVDLKPDLTPPTALAFTSNVQSRDFVSSSSDLRAELAAWRSIDL